MRIDALNQVAQLYQANQTRKVDKASGVQQSDRLEISQIGREYQVAKNAVAAVPDVRMDRVTALKEQIASGTYAVKDEELADKLLGNYFDASAILTGKSI